MDTEPQAITDARRERMMQLLGRGKSRKEVAKQYGISRQRLAQIVGKIEFLGERKEFHVYSVPDLFKVAVGIAEEHGLLNRAGKTAGEGSVGSLIEQIALGNLVVVKPEQVCDQTGHLGQDSAGLQAAA